MSEYLNEMEIDMRGPVYVHVPYPSPPTLLHVHAMPVRNVPHFIFSCRSG